MADRDQHLPSDEPADVLARIYQAAATRLRRLIRAGVARQGRDAGSVRYRQQQLSAIVQILARLRRDSRRAEQAAITRAYAAGVVIASLEPDIAFGGVHQRTVAVLAAEIGHTLDSAVGTVGRQAADVFRRVGLEQTAIGRAAGETRAHVSAHIVAELERQGITAFKDRAGRRWPLEAYARMVARTTSREAATIGTVNRMGEAGEDLIQISSHRHEPDICSPFDGKIFSLSGESPRYPKVTKLPPLHPNCVHVCYPARLTFEEARKAVSAASSIEELERALHLRA